MSAARTFVPRRVRAGPWTITALTDGAMWLDGGSMWGVVPKTLWARLTPPADDNTIRLALRPFLAERGGDRVVIEVGIGDRWEEKWRSIYRFERATTLVDALAACGLAPKDVTHVVASHCHFDHVGAQVVLRDGELVPLFPNARHFAPALEIAIAKDPGHVRRASYRADDVVPVERAGLLEGFGSPERDAAHQGASRELLPGLRVHDASGHSDGVHVVTLNEDGPGETAIFWSDVVPTSHHVQPAYIMAYDLDVARSFESRSRWLELAADGGWIGLFYHDPEHAFGRVRRDPGRGGTRYAFEPLEGERVPGAG